MKKDLLKMADLTAGDIEKLLNRADQMKYNMKHGIHHDELKNRVLVMLFEKSSTRTRVSLETGMYQLGGHAIYLSGKDSQIHRGEPVEDTARTLSRYCDGILIRTFRQEEVEEMAKYADVPVFNGMSDYTHPFQMLADLMTIRERKVRFEDLTACYIGSGNNMCNAMIVGCLLCGMHVRIACPEQLLPADDVLQFARSVPSGQFELMHDAMEAAKGADVIFTDVWVSQGQEDRAEELRQLLQSYRVTDDVLRAAKPDCLIQHPLPARKGEEITKEIFEQHAGEIFDEAENRMYVQNAVLSLYMQGGD